MFLKCMRQALFVLWYLTLNDSILDYYHLMYKFITIVVQSMYVSPPFLSHFVLVMNKAL